MTIYAKTAGAFVAALVGIACWANGASAQEVVEFKGKFLLLPDSNEGVLVISADVAEGHYLYSLTQKELPPTKIEVEESESFSVTGKFQPSKKPKLVYDDIFETNLEKHFGKIDFILPIKLAGAVDVESLEITAKLTGQACSDATCTRINGKKIVAAYGGRYEPKKEDDDDGDDGR